MGMSRKICGQESDSDGGVILMEVPGKRRKTDAGVVGQHQERLVGERIVGGGSARPS